MNDNEWYGDNYKIEKKPQEVLDFLDEIETVCKKYGISISHEDTGGAFKLERYSQDTMDWLKQTDKGYQGNLKEQTK